MNAKLTQITEDEIENVFANSMVELNSRLGHSAYTEEEIKEGLQTTKLLIQILDDFGYQLTKK